MLIHLLYFTIFFEVIFGLKLTVDIPKYKMIGQSAEFKCNYELGNNELYAVKWYKGINEFYRYVPKDNPPGQVFNTSGVLVNLTLSNDTMVVLENVQLATSGVYGCEVSEEAPSFQTETKSEEMMVVDPPTTEKPTISGVSRKYRVGDFVNVNCSAPKSSPPATLEWTVNGEKVEETDLEYFPPTSYNDSKASSTLGLKFQVKEFHFKNDGITLKCLARVEPFYYGYNQRSILGDHPKAAVLESRGYGDASPGNNARRLQILQFLPLSLPALVLSLVLTESPSLVPLLIR